MTIETWTRREKWTWEALKGDGEGACIIIDHMGFAEYRATFFKGGDYVTEASATDPERALRILHGRTVTHGAMTNFGKAVMVEALDQWRMDLG